MVSDVLYMQPCAFPGFFAENAVLCDDFHRGLTTARASFAKTYDAEQWSSAVRIKPGNHNCLAVSACITGSTDQARSPFFPRWGQPAQQQGRRFPSLSSVRTLSIRLRLVSGFLASSTQQIHSLRASGVMSSHSASAALSAVRVFRKSAGTPCTTPVAISLLDINLFCQFFCRNAQRFNKFRASK